MHFLDYYYGYIVKYDLLNKFNYKNIKNFPKIKKIILNWNYINAKQSLSTLLSLNLLVYQKSKLKTTKTTNIYLKIQKGDPILIQVILINKTLINLFLSKLILHLTFNYKQTNIGKFFFFKSSLNSFIFKFKKSLNFIELEKNFKFFNQLKNLQIIILTSSRNKKELIFLLKSYKFPL